MMSREEALAKLSRVFRMIAEEYAEKGLPMPTDTTENRSCLARRPGNCRVSLGGWASPRRGRQGHERCNHPGGAVTIPLHGGREIGPPLFFKILRQLGITLEEFSRCGNLPGRLAALGIVQD